jgi:hypothetical protein
MKFCPECGHQFTAGNEKFCPICGYDINKGGGISRDRNSVNIENTGGDIFGVGVSGSGHTIGKNIVVGSGTISVSQQELEKNPASEYAKALKDFSENLNQQLKGREIPEEEVKSIKNGLNELAKEVQDIKPMKDGVEAKQEIDYVKESNIQSKTASVIQRVLTVLPEAAENIALFTPLAPISKLIGKGIQQIVDAIANKRKL